MFFISDTLTTKRPLFPCSLSFQTINELEITDPSAFDLIA